MQHAPLPAKPSRNGALQGSPSRDYSEANRDCLTRSAMGRVPSPGAATGKALAELIDDGAARSIDLSPFDPNRLRSLDPALLRSS